MVVFGYLHNYVSFLLIYISIPSTQSVRYCGQWICHGAAYCCGEYLDQCCFYSQIYQFWWFWLIWAGVFFVLATCSYLCWRQKTEQNLLNRQQNNPAISVPQSNPSSSSSGAGMPPPPPYQNYQTYDIPGQPPVVMPVPPAYEEKPPDYTP